jgi:hypothetical protein
LERSSYSNYLLAFPKAGYRYNNVDIGWRHVGVHGQDVVMIDIHSHLKKTRMSKMLICRHK